MRVGLKDLTTATRQTNKQTTQHNTTHYATTAKILDRDFYMDSSTAKVHGLIDEVIAVRPKEPTILT